MDQNDELSLWLAHAWLQASGQEVQAILVEDLRDQAASGTPLSESIDALGSSRRQAGDFGMEIAGALLAPVLVELLKEFWSAYVKKLAEDLAGKLADASTSGLKSLFLSALARDDGDAVPDLVKRVHRLAADKKISRQDADRLVAALRNPKLAQELRHSRPEHRE
jgi:hypothetical protein